MAHATTALADRLAAETTRGLRQISLDIAAAPGVPVEALAAEAVSLFSAIDAVRAVPLDFGDGTRV